MQIYKNIKKMLAYMLAAAILCAIAPCVLAENNVYAEFYVDAVNGSDSYRGTKDAPFKTVKRATEAVKSISGLMTGDIYVWFADGRYELSEPVKFEKRTGGKDNYKVIYKAMKDAEPVISGGKQITGWELFDSEKNIYRASARGVYSRHFSVDGVLQVRARTDGGLDNVKLDYGKIGFTSSNVEFASYRNKEDIESVHVQSFYRRQRLFKDISLIDENTVQFAFTDRFKKARTGITAWTKPSWIENVFEHLDKEGEFYIDKKENMIYYKPKAGQNMDEVLAVIPVMEELFAVGGYNYYDRTKNIVFDGFTFTDTTWMLTSELGGLDQLQDGYIYNKDNVKKSSSNTWDTFVNPAAISISKASGVEILNCDFKALGASAVRALEGTEKLSIIGNHMRDIAGGAIYIGTVTQTEINPKDTRRTIRDVVIKNNYIHHVATEQWGAAAVSAAYPYNCSITHNEIHDVPYSGAHIGWGWSSKQDKTLLKFVFEYNYVHDFMQHMGDGGGIYTLGYTSATPEDPNKIVNNYFKDCWSNHLMAGGMIYLDNTSSNWRIEGNVIDNIKGSEKWDGNMFANTSYTPLNNYWIRNYHTKVNTKVTDTKTNCRFEDNQHHPAANWPDEAREVIRKSGLEPAYRHLSPRNYEYAKVFTDEFVNLNIGDKHKLSPTATAEFCEEVSMEGAKVSYAIDDASVATVDANGLITALKEGQTKITTTVTINGVTHTAPTTVSIGSGLAKVEITTKTPAKILKGEVKNIPGVRGINFGGSEIEGELKNIKFTSSNPDVFYIDEEAKTMTAKEYGEATITYSAEYDGVTRTGEHHITVVDYADQSGLLYPPTKMDDILEDFEGWNPLSGEIIQQENGLSFKQTGTVQYQSQKYCNELFDVYLSLDQKATWPSIALRVQAENVGLDELNSMYLVGFAKNGIEVQRFNGMARTVFFATLSPQTRIGNIHPMVLEEGRKYHVQVGTINEEGGVRIIVNIDGVNVINVLDDGEGRIEQEGYLGLFVTGTTMNLTTN